MIYAMPRNLSPGLRRTPFRGLPVALRCPTPGTDNGSYQSVVAFETHGTDTTVVGCLRGVGAVDRQMRVVDAEPVALRVSLRWPRREASIRGH